LDSKISHSDLAATLAASGLTIATPAFAQSTTSMPEPAKQTTQPMKRVKEQHQTDGEGVTGNDNFAHASK
jgi:hypothetical protein